MGSASELCRLMVARPSSKSASPLEPAVVAVSVEPNGAKVRLGEDGNE